MNKKRILALLAVLALIICMLPCAFAAQDAAPAQTPTSATEAAVPATGTDGAPVDGEPVAAPWWNGIGGFIPMILIVVVFYFFLIRPESKRKKQTAQMRDSLKVNDEITTIGGIVGRITNINDEEITIETGAEKNKLRVMRWAISTKSSKNED